jgi:acyl-CoA thioesterase-1
MLTVYTFGDSILDCSHCNDKGVDPCRLLVNNNDQLFPEFQGRDLFTATNEDAVTELRAYDGSFVDALVEQMEDLEVEEPSIALLTIGSSDLFSNLLEDQGSGIEEFAQKLKNFLDALPIRPVLIATIYDSTFGDDSSNLFGAEPTLGRENLRRINAILTSFGGSYGAVVDLHAHFLQGQPDWFSGVIEPSLVGASEVRRCFLEVIEANGFV